MPRDVKDYAIEFGEYLAKAAKRFMDAHNAQHAATEAEQDVTEAWRGLEDAIYEFRKRATRAGHAPSAIEFAK